MIYINNFLHVFTASVDLSSEIVRKQTVNVMLSIAKPLILQVLDDVNDGTFFLPSGHMGSTRLHRSGLSNLCGLYLIINKNTKKIYLGGSKDLALRKADYTRNFGNPERLPKVYNSMREDLQNFGPESFYFVPLLVFRHSQVCFNTTTTRETEDQQLKIFLDSHLENAVLTLFIGETSTYRTRFYNVATIGAFQPGNAYGGSPGSGQPSRSLRFKDLYAWESVSAAASSLLVDRSSIRNLRNCGKIIEISITEFNEFTGTKITNSDAESFFTRPENHIKLKQLRGSNGFNLRMNKRFQQFLTQFSLGNGEP